MFEKHASRVLIVAGALLIALLTIFSPVLQKLIHPSQHIDRWLNLNPGIDIVGGTSLLYEIKKPPGGAQGHTDLATQVMIALKRRVDPLGTRNLIWRPEGNDRLEIQMPFSSGTKENAQKRVDAAKQVLNARTELDATNIRSDDVIDAVESKNGRTRADLARLADGDPTRTALFDKLTAAYDAMQAAHKAQDAFKEATLRGAYNKLTDAGTSGVNPIDATNLRATEIDDAISAPESAAQIKALKAKFPGFTARLTAIDDYVAAADTQSKLKNAIGDTEDLKRMLRGSGVLEFHIEVGADDYMGADRDEIEKMKQRLAQVGPRVEANDRMRWYVVDKADLVRTRSPVYDGQPYATYDGKPYNLLWMTPEKSLDHRIGQPQWALTGASQQMDQNKGQSVVGFRFDAAGGAAFGQLTGGNINRPMAVVLDDKIVNVATIISRIDGSGQIDGGPDGFSASDLEYLINTLTAGSLPAQLAEEPISERTVGPQLGADNLVHGLVACGLGLIVVAVFLTSYYYLAGMVATFAVFMNVVLILGTMAALNATFTLPSIAGIVLTIGTAVDANVLIFERLREEQHRGLSLRMALRNAYGKAFSAIVDSNMTTVITSLALIMFGTEEVKGFGITLIIGIVASLFTALFVTRTIFDVLIDVFHVKELNSLPLTFPKWDRLLRPNIDWMRLVWGFVIFSVIAITVGMTMFVKQAQAGHMLDIEFASGTSVDFELKQPMERADVQSLFDTRGDSAAIPAPSVVAVESTDGRPNTAYEVITPNADSARVKSEVLKVLGDSLLTELPSKFDASSQPVADALKSGAVKPLTKETIADAASWPEGFVPPGVRDYSGGAAIILNHLDPPLSTDTIRQRLIEQQLQSDTSPLAAQREFVVQSPKAVDTKTSLAVILIRDEVLPYEKDKDQWQAQLVAPMWKLASDAIDRPAQLQKVENFNAAVAGDTQKDAFMALGLSVLVIMGYIWVRFGNLKYGTATVVALLHDTIFVVAALGFAHYLVLIPGLRQALLLEPFRINLVVVAGILTIMGYSMIDTIVVFDRIRENRGKYGLVSRSIINDAVNQTLSRTLLTAGTTTMTVAIMYFFGGPGIHGFTFVLLVGILVGTYSSVAIAAPILLFGNTEEPPSPKERSAAQLEKAGT
jgi:SecD/SecF fusion protein